MSFLIDRKDRKIWAKSVHCCLLVQALHLQSFFLCSEAFAASIGTKEMQVACILPGVPIEVVNVRPKPLASKGEVNGVLAVLQGQGLQLGRAGHKCPAAAWQRLSFLGSHKLTHHAGCLWRQL